ncbi:CRISPR-associated protein Cas10/Csm1, subtype III-A/MTUBE [Persephonella hydrogeniphila]|uniref:CRISPR system single-strand-specific deoxyribonuclease Cas10/Csm1 (subtype III-A) n=1 Tax=Persephonella hydrogeniphila TaxID=198703 RepID=A0A285NN20_9AQUI|nr:type III-A CRISPR-associated protein Cas10/Csm1 [Persephonella hydrogeniphila]SNZ10618.1 CRISPR-associated protein Cas10/Csm1, subtype III-A/MTUBE [Persephonella hydrogeniphila]
MQEIEKIALAGLLHDIGKFYQRAKNPQCKYNQNEFKYAHACLSYQWILENKDLLGKPLNIDIEEIAKIASKHHNPTKDKNLEKIMQLADWFSSAEREKVLEDEIDYLHSVFERVSFEEEVNEDFKYYGYYKLKPLSLDKDTIFPESMEGFFEGKKVKLIDREGRTIEDKLGKYEELFNQFQSELQIIKNFQGRQAFNFIYYLLQKYLWCIPASTFDREKLRNHYPDISLFDHSRVLSAVASVIYDYHTKTKEPLDFSYLEKKDFFLLVEGNISGIQKFIYNIGKIQGIENFSISKALRGRSFLVSLIPEIISRYILKKLGYTITNLLYSGGGKFQILVANTNENIRSIQDIEKELEEYFYKNYGGELGIVLSYLPFSGRYLTGKDGKSYAHVIEKNQIELDKKKKRKFSKFLIKDLKDSKYICPSCKTMPVDKENDLCSLCKISNDIGSKIPKIKYIVFENKLLKDVKEVDLETFGKAYLVTEEEINKFKNAEEILILNSTEFDKNNGFKFLGNTVPVINRNNIEFFRNLEIDKEKANKLKEGQVLEFKYLAELAQGDKKLGVFRADVDNLGLIFSDGLKRKTEEESDRYTISRIATLSRMLDLFFSGYINTLAKEISKEYLKNNKIENFTNINSLIYIVYSGGDDLFITAPYDIAIEFAQKLRENFYEYTCKNLNFGLSGGIFITSATIPIHLSAKYSKNLESKSKKTFYKKSNELYFKDSISIFNKTYKWKEFKGKSSLENLVEKEPEELLSNIGLSERANLVFFDTINELSREFLKYKDQISRSFFYKLREYYEVYVKNGKYINAGIYPKIYYQIARNFKDNKDKNVRNFLEELLIKGGYKKNGKVMLEKEDVIKNLDVITSLVLMKIRGGI